MATRTHNPLRPEIGRHYRLRGYLGGERIAQVFEIDTRRGLIYARDPDGHVFRWTRALWRRECIERIE